MTNSDSSNSSDGTVVCDHLDFTYNAQNALTLTDINFELPQGSRTLLLGGNGSGKSTLLRVLSGRHMASGGKGKHHIYRSQMQHSQRPKHFTNKSLTKSNRTRRAQSRSAARTPTAPLN